MKRIILLLLACILLFNQPYCLAKEKKASILLLISEQNIESPQHAWWVSSVDLSAFEAKLAQTLMLHGYSVLTPAQVTRVLRREKAFRRVNMSDNDTIKLAQLSKADYVVIGKAVASSGTNVAGSNMRSCFANATAKLFAAKEEEIVAYLAASGSSVHVDPITGGQEALTKVAESLAVKIINVLSQ